MADPSTPQAQQPGPSHIVTAVQSGLSYDVGELSPKSQTNAEDALSNNRMSMVRCYQHGNNFHFELQERVRVTFHDRRAPSCSICPDDEGRACRHIWWVDDQILNTMVTDDIRSRFQYQVSRDGQAVRPAVNQQPRSFHDWLKAEGLEELARQGGWWKQDPTNQQDTRLVEQTTTHILSIFEPCGVLPAQHGQDNFEMLQQESQALFARYKNEMIKQVKSQPFLLIALGAAVPEAERNLLHLTKIHSRIESIFFDFGHWMATRTPSHGNLDATTEALHVEIGHLSSFIQEHQIKSRALGRHMPEALQIKTAGILLYTLEQLADYSGDIQTHAVVPIPQYSGLNSQDRSLLHKLIHPRPQNAFLLPVLDQLDDDVLFEDMIQDRVRAVAQKLRGAREPCPEEYIKELEEVVGLDE
ncbi:hypothetical protein QM012_007113 [Aureobasidium pullulans]|uniref:SWIM-type domain-containing protein n=1 Tax=Aureobasidium pullulans TaxID=5580 RepID=A0ABR0TMY6_AURPU